jgi:GGDEF domain-containing protein
LRAIATATSEQSLQDLRERLEAYLHPAGTSSSPVEASQLKKSDFSTANDNAAGLRGGGSAIEDLKKLMEKNNQGSVVIFRLSCLNMISQRFGPEAVEDCLMAVAAFLTERLHADDTIYHWSDSSLLAILQGRPNEQILNSELERISMQNRETTVSIGGHCTMLRIPLTFDVTPIERLKSSEDLNKISLLSYGGSAR